MEAVVYIQRKTVLATLSKAQLPISKLTLRSKTFFDVKKKVNCKQKIINFQHGAIKLVK